MSPWIRAVSLLLLSISAFCSCAAPPRYRTEPSFAATSNELFKMVVATPQKTLEDVKNPPKRLVLAILNKTSRDLQVVWSKTFYIHDGAIRGAFSVEPKDESDRLSDGLVPAKGRLLWDLYPKALLQEDSGSHDVLPHGQNGVFLTVRDGEMEVHGEASVRIIAGE